MNDELVSTLLQASGIRVLLATTSALARKARDLMHAEGAAAALLAQGLTAGVLLGALQKDRSRINLQLECDGPLRGMFVDADNQGSVRGYVKNPGASVTGTGAFRWRPVLGNSGFLSVLRDLGGGEFYRSSVQLEAFELSADLERYFQISDQLRTHLSLGVAATGGESLGAVGGVLIQPLPDGDAEKFDELGRKLAAGGFEQALAAHGEASPTQLLREVFGDLELEVMSRFPLSYSCTCSADRVKQALVAMGKAELEDLLAKEGKAEVSCQFCTTRYVISGDEIRELLKSAAG